MNDRLQQLIQEKQGIFLDLACGDHKDMRAIGFGSCSHP